MILQSLVAYYDALARKGKITKTGWSIAKVSYALVLDKDGSLSGIVSKKIDSEDQKKPLPAQITVPEQIKKTSGTASNFMCENAAYFLGYDSKGKPDKALKCFEAAKALHHQLLDSVETSAAKRVLLFFDTWDPAKAAVNEFVVPLVKDIEKGANFVFADEDGNLLHTDQGIAEAWGNYKGRDGAGTEFGRCLVTGEEASIAILHPSIKGIRGAQSSGASLVSFNAPASESYGNDGAQGKNAPVSELAAFKYGTALNFLISDGKHVQYVADTALIYWSEDAEPIYQDIFDEVLTGSEHNISDSDLKGIFRQLAAGGDFEVNGVSGKYDNRFYVLGIAPNAARLSVRFFLQDEFGKMIDNLNEHNRRTEIIQPMEEHRKLPLWAMLNETANQNSSNKMPPPPMAGSVLRSIVLNIPYPNALYETVIMRIRAERDIKWRKAAIIKAFFLKNYKNNKRLQEAATVSVNETDYEPYVLGRIFAVLEMIQKSANPGIKTTIRDKYFSGAAATPAHIFPILISLAQHHLKKLNDRSGVYYDKLLTQLQNKITSSQYPARQSLQDQGAFYLGYYHEKQALYTKKGNETEETDHE